MERTMRMTRTSASAIGNISCNLHSPFLIPVICSAIHYIMCFGQFLMIAPGAPKKTAPESLSLSSDPVSGAALLCFAMICERIRLPPLYLIILMTAMQMQAPITATMMLPIVP